MSAEDKKAFATSLAAAKCIGVEPILSGEFGKSVHFAKLTKIVGI